MKKMHLSYLPVVIIVMSICIGTAQAQNWDEKPYAAGKKTWQKIEGPFFENCTKCHQQLGERIAEQVTEWRNSVHYRNGVFCDSCHGGDPISTILPIAMGEAYGFKPEPGPKEVPAFCGPECHKDAFDINEGNLHTEDFEENNWQPHCVFCHGSHEVQEVNTDLITLETPTCGPPCHDRDYYIRQTEKQALVDANELVDKLYGQLEAMPDINPMKPALRVRLDKAYKELRKLAHYFDRKKIRAAKAPIDQELAYIQNMINFDVSAAR